MSKLTNMMGQVRSLKNGVGVQCLLDEAYKILGNPIAMFNTEYNLLAYAGVNTDDPIWVELVKDGAFSKETRMLFYNEGFIEEIVNAPRVALFRSEKLKYDRYAGKVFNRNNVYVSTLILVGCDKAFEENDAIVFDAVCKLISREISGIESYQEYEQSHQEAIIKNLLDGTYDVKLDLAQVGIIYDSLESNLYVAVVDMSLCGPDYDNITYFRSLFMQIEPEFKYAIYSNHIIIIVSTNDNILNVNKELSELIKLFEQYNMYAGISGKFENLFKLRKHYEEAMEAMRYTLEMKCSQRIYPCNPGSVDTMKQIEELKYGMGLQYFLDAAPDIFGNPVLFHDMELNLLAYSQNVEIVDPIWIELINYGTSSDETINLFKTTGFINIMENTKGGAFLISEKIKYDRISWRIYSNDNIMIGCLSIVNSDKPFTDDELILFGALSQKFSKEVGKIDFYNKYGRVYSETVINRLISGKIDDYTFYSEDIGNLYNNLMDNIYLAVVDTSQPGNGHINLSYIRGLLAQSDTVNRYAIYSNYIIIVLSMDRVSLDDNNEFGDIKEVFEQNNIFAGISSRIENIYELQKYYVEAVDALTDGLKTKAQHGKQRIFLYHDQSDSS